MHDTPETARDALAAIVSPYDATADAAFEAAMVEADAWHKSRNKAYAAMWDGNARPLLPVGLFKRLDLNTPVSGPGAWLASSGTGQGGPARVFYDAASMARVEKGMGTIFMRNGILSQEPSRFLLLSPDPRTAEHAGYATAFLKFTGCAPVRECVFACDDAGRFLPDLAWATLARWSATPEPVFLFGLTVFFEQLFLSATNPVTFSGPVKGITGGGWKGLTKTQERSETIDGLRNILRAPLFDIRDIYGMTEHPLHYLSCPEGHFHIPAYSRFSILDPAGNALPAGRAGAIRLQNPFFASLPAHDLLTEDSGAWGTQCSCGEPLPYIRFLGRMTSSEGTCAHDAAERQ